jgi:hypothetical protein
MGSLSDGPPMLTGASFPTLGSMGTYTGTVSGSNIDVGDPVTIQTSNGLMTWNGTVDSWQSDTTWNASVVYGDEGPIRPEKPDNVTVTVSNSYGPSVPFPILTSIQAGG